MKPNKHKKYLALFMVLVMVSLYSFVPPPSEANAIDSIKNASDTISDSHYGTANVTHTFDFETGTTTPQNGYWRFTFPAEFTSIVVGGVTCGYGDAAFTASSTIPTVVDCQVTGVGGMTPTTTQMVLTGVTNPNPGSPTSYMILLENYNDSDILKERVQMRVVILGHTTMTARVDASLTFTVAGTTTSASVNGIGCDQNTTATTTDFGTLLTTASTTVCQDLSVTTNANYGFIVTVEEDDELTSDSGANINSFNNSPDNTGTTTPEAWAVPTGILDQDHTYGHMGLTSNDDDAADAALMANDYYQGGVAMYVGLHANDPTTVMAHNGPADGLTQNKGYASIAYTAEISALQQAGDYETVITYICTPTY